MMRKERKRPSKKRRKDRDPSSSPSSSSEPSSSEDSYSDDSESSGRRGSRRRRKNRGRRKNKKVRSGSATLKAVHALTEATHKMAEQNEKKRSVFKMLTDKQVDLLKLLSARNWDDRDPHMNSEANRLTENRDTALIFNNVRDWMTDEKGDVYKEGLIGFLTNGYSHDEQPGRFTCFFVHPKEYDDTTQEEQFQFLRGVLGSSDATDEMIKSFSKQRWFLPERIEQAEIQLESTARLLDMMTRHKGIASEGYWQGLKLLRSNRRSFAKELRRNNLFLVEFLHYLDLVFQAFCLRLLKYRSERRPIVKARQRLEYFMEGRIARTFDSLEMGIVPRLTLPKVLLGKSQNPRAAESDSDHGARNSRRTRASTRPRTGGGRTPPKYMPGRSPRARHSETSGTRRWSQGRRTSPAYQWYRTMSTG
jgi:hypothetical protein